MIPKKLRYIAGVAAAATLGASVSSSAQTIADLVLDIPALDVQVSDVEADLLTNSTLIAYIQADLTLIEGDVVSNLSLINGNTVAIGDLAADLTLVEGDVANSLALISGYTVAIGDVAADLTVVQGNVASNLALINALDFDVDVLTTQVNNNWSRRAIASIAAKSTVRRAAPQRWLVFRRL